MKKFYSIMMLCLCCMAFVSCESTEDDINAGIKFKACAFVATPTFSQDLHNLYDFTMTYTAMDGTVTVVKPDADGALYMEDVYTKLPATVKYEVKAVKKANFDEYLKSKEAFDFRMISPGYVAQYITATGELTILNANVTGGGVNGIRAEAAAEYLEKNDKYFNFTIEGTYTKTDNGTCSFKVKK